MKKKILSVLLIMLLVASVFALTGCDNKTTSSESDVKTEENKSSNEQEEKNGRKDKDKDEKKEAADDNDNYFIKIKGEKFKAGDKISSLKKVGISQDEKVLEEKVKKHVYVIGAGTLYNEDHKRVLNMTPYNDSDEEITVADAVIGGLEVGEYQYDKIPQEVLDLNVEVAGGIKLGSTLEDVEKVFGVTDNTYKADSLGYIVYTYKSSQTYRSYEITVDKDGKVSKIHWQNLVYND